ncbi:MAG TPA: glycan-binding surface protein [Ohtaekwangia sp.]|uniref:glycan-binding surface protein n=1 Tax=Ohtaekwangia sp. TaxID=2066019 RepID=UPI002F938A9A
MKNILYMRLCMLQLLCTVVMLTFITGCKDDDDMRVPVIDEVRNYAASPDDTIITSLNDGQWVVLHGKNMTSASQVYFGSIPATFNRAFATDETLVVQVPPIPFLSVPRDKLNVITVVSKGGISTYEIIVTGTPIIVNVRNTDGEMIDRVFPEQQINIVGVNLSNATNIRFQGIAADLSTVVYTDSSTIVQVPANLSGGDASLVNTISYTTGIGTGNFSIRIVGPPIITSISHEIPQEGEAVYLYGYNFVSVESITFAGVTISSFEESEDGNSVKFVSPKLTESGTVTVVTPGGTFSTAFKVNDIGFINAGGLGILGNLEWGDYFSWQWWGGSVDLWSSDPNTTGWPPYNADYGIGTGQYITYKSVALKAGEGSDGNAIRLGEYAWVPSGNLNDSGDKWAFKFEINVTKPWNGGTLCIRTDKGDYLALYEPWKISAKESAAFTTDGWQTVTIPLSSFRKKDATLGDGKGDPITKVSDLLNIATGKTYLNLYLHNYGTKTTTSIEAAFDNFRVVKR